MNTQSFSRRRIVHAVASLLYLALVCVAYHAWQVRRDGQANQAPKANRAFKIALDAKLGADIDAILDTRILSKGSVGVEIARLGNSLDSSTIIYSQGADLPIMPASNLKLITTSAILDRLGSDFEFHTRLVMHGPDLILIGDGDPSLGDGELLRRSGSDVTTLFENWAQILKMRGISSVRNVLVDDSIFDDTFFHPRWPADEAQKHYAAEVAGLGLNANCVDVEVRPAAPLVEFTLNPPTQYIHLQNTCTTGEANNIVLSRTPGANDVILSGTCPTTTPSLVTVHDPALFAGTVLAETLEKSGIQITGHVLRDRTARAAFSSSAATSQPSWTLVAVYTSSLPDVIRRTLKDSMSIYADTLCKRLGFAASGQPGSWTNGTAAASAFLEQLGFDSKNFHLDDGCGLSLDNRVTSHTILTVLTYDYFCKNHQAFFNSLSIAGRDGTLLKRFADSPLRGRVFAKSGTETAMSALSGYLYANDNRWYVFSILINGNTRSVKLLEEQIVEAIDRRSGP